MGNSASDQKPNPILPSDEEDVPSSEDIQTHPPEETPDTQEEGHPPQTSPESTPSQGEDISQDSQSIATVKVIFDTAPDTRLRITVESFSAINAEQENTSTPSARVVFESQSPGNEPFLIVEPPTSSTIHIRSATASTSWFQDILASARLLAHSWPYSLELTLFGLALGVYLLTHLIGLAKFPIYFFTDEAIQTLSATDLIHNHFMDEEGTIFPTYFKNGPYFNLSVSVYAQILSYLFFGKSIFVTRATSVLISLIAAISIGLMLRDIFKSSYWWIGVCLLTLAPTWFLHSRTAFETVMFVSFYAGFLYLYALYRYRSPHYLYYALLLAALAFYSYSPGQLILGVTGVLLLFSDARYHWQNRGVVLRGVGLGILLALPYLRFRLDHPAAWLDHLRTLGSYWVQPLSLNEKIARFAREYFFGLSPGYWFLPNDDDLPRHIMKGYGHLFRATLPFAVLGFIIAIKEFRSSAHRMVLISMFAAPVGSALVSVGITRLLVLVIPATLLTALGIALILNWLESKKLSHKLISITLFLGLTILSVLMLRDVLVNSPTWFKDYGLGGMQYGASQLFTRIEERLEQDPDTKLIVSPTWANGADILARYFLGDPLPIEMGSIEGHIFQHLPLEDNTLFIMTPEEYQLTTQSGKFKDITIDETLPYPNGQSGFYFVSLKYVDNIDAIIESERLVRRELQTTVVNIDGELVEVKYPQLDMGEAYQMFDGDPYTLIRTLEADPAVIEITYPSPRSMAGVSIIIGSTQADITAQVYQPGDEESKTFRQTLQGTIDNPEVFLPFNETLSAEKLRLAIDDIHQEEPAHIHIWEIIFH